MTPAARRFALFVWLPAAGALLALAFAFDATVQSWMQTHATTGGLRAMRQVSLWGDWPMHALLGVMAGALAWVLQRREWARIFGAMVLACALAGLLNTTVKIGTGRSRPAVKEHVGWNGPSLRAKYHSFPSGHTAASTAFFSAVLLARRRLGALFLAIPAVIAFSRLYLNAHHLSDVIAGALLGFGCALLAWRLMQRIWPNECNPEAKTPERP